MHNGMFYKIHMLIFLYAYFSILIALSKKKFILTYQWITGYMYGKLRLHQTMCTLYTNLIEGKLRTLRIKLATMDGFHLIKYYVLIQLKF